MSQCKCMCAVLKYVVSEYVAIRYVVIKDAAIKKHRTIASQTNSLTVCSPYVSMNRLLR